MTEQMKRLPREPTAEMLAAAARVNPARDHEIYQAMFDAATDADTGRVAELETRHRMLIERIVELERELFTIRADAGGLNERV